jgi:hypothetical protein
MRIREFFPPFFDFLAYGELLDASDPDRWRYWGLAASKGVSYQFLSYFQHEVDLFYSGTGGSAAVVFAIGRALKGHVQEDSLFGFYGSDWINVEPFISPAKKAVSFFQGQLKCARRAVDAWTLIGIRFKVVKDVRKVIGMLIWESRSEAKYN